MSASGGMTLMEVLRTAAFALRGNWLRSALTSLGVIIGIAAVIVMVSVGQGTQKEIDKLVSGLGSQRLDINPGGGRGFGGVRVSSSNFFTLTNDDADAIRREVPNVQYVGATLRGNSQVIFAENNWSTSWQGIESDWFEINGWELGQGELFDARDYSSGAKSVLIGETVRRELFGDEQGIGESIRIGRPRSGRHRDDAAVDGASSYGQQRRAAARRGAADFRERFRSRCVVADPGGDRSAVAAATQDSTGRGRRLQRA
jgi:putative ABC transport system permease protein